jgi:hypothetical protein
MDQPIEYVGGEPERPRGRPWWVLAVVSAGLVLGLGVVLAGPGLVASARSLSQEALPYTIQVRGTWSAPDQVVGGPVSLLLEVKNTDSRALRGITVRFSGLSPRWMVLAASPDGQVNQATIYFSRTLAPGESESLQVHLLPIQSGQSVIRLSLAPERSGKAMRLVTASGIARGLITTVSIRDAGPGDLAVTPHLFYTDPNLVNESSLFKTHVDNTGAVRITSLTIRFAQLPASFELQSTQPSATAGADGHSVVFPLTLDPGTGADLSVYYVPHRTGTYHVSLQFFLQGQADPVVLSDGTTSIDVDVAVH